MTPTGSTYFAMEIHGLRQLLAEKDAEIERLKAENNSLRLDAVENRRLITELCDALDIMTQLLLISKFPLEWEQSKRRENETLLQRAREATK
jgi:hypothetical protein